MHEKKFPQPVVGILLYDEKGKVLLASHKKRKHKYVCIGGKVEFGETLEQACCRELKEETGLIIPEKELVYLCFQQAVLHQDFHSEHHFIFFDYLVKIDSNTTIIINEEMENEIWIYPEDALKTLELTESVKIFLENFISYIKPSTR